MTESKQKILARASQHWSSVSEQKRGAPLRNRWWMNEAICRHINARFCGTPHAPISKGLTELLKAKYSGTTFKRGISVGCGNGAKEMAVLHSGLVETFECFEISDVRVAQGRELAARHKLSDRIVFRQEDGFAVAPKDSYDCVHWNNALHHMLDVDAAVLWSRDVLRKGGLFMMDDFVGPNRFQWSDLNLDYATRVRRLLPERLMVDAARPGRTLSRTVERPLPERVIATDPTEAVESEKIISSIRKYFPDAVIKLTGGCLYHLALNDVIANFTVDDAPLLNAILLADDALAEAGHSHYAMSYAIKS